MGLEEGALLKHTSTSENSPRSFQHLSTCGPQAHAQNQAFAYDCQVHKPIKGNAYTKIREQHHIIQEVNQQTESINLL